MEPHKTHISRGLATQYGKEAVAICRFGEYRTSSGKVVKVANFVQQSIAGTRTYPPESQLPLVTPVKGSTLIEVANETTLAAAKRLRDAGTRPVVLNFASATSPGGGFLHGALAQEEYLARSSGLYACLERNPMYAYHLKRDDTLYTNYAIYSPDVPVFRSDEGDLLETVYTVGIITSPAVNATHLSRSGGREIGPAMEARIAKVLSLGLIHGHDAIVLGAWGCGAFGNDPREIASIFRSALNGTFRGAYARVIFAILDWSIEQRFIGPFQAEFDDDQSTIAR